MPNREIIFEVFKPMRSRKSASRTDG